MDKIQVPQVIIVGNADIHEWFTTYWTEWDTQTIVLTVDDMWAGLEDGSLSTTSEYVIFDEQLFDPADPDSDFAQAVATFAPEALVMVTSYDVNNQPILRQAVDNARKQFGLEDGVFYFLNVWDETFNPQIEVDNAIAERKSWEQNRFEQRQGSAPTHVEENNTAQNAAASPQAQPVVKTQPTSPAYVKKGIVVASTSSKGGSGKTTVALCTASMLYHASRIATERGERDKPLDICIVDMDTRDGQIGFLLGQTSPSALNIYLNPDKSIDAIRQNLIYDEKLGIHALLAPKRARTADFLTPDFYRDVIEKLSTIFDVVMLDTSVNYLDPLLGQIVLPIADAVLFVTNLSIGSVYGMTRWMDEVTSAVEDGGSGIDKGKIGIVINQSLPGVGVDQELLQQAASGATLLVAIPLDSQAVIAASNYNSLSEIVLKHENISPSYYQLAKKLVSDTPMISPMELLEVSKKPQSNKQQQDAMPVSKKRSRLFGGGRR